MANQDLVLNVVRGVFALLAVLATVVFVLRPLLRHLFHPLDSSFLNPTLPDIVEGEEIEVPTEAEPGVPDRHTLLTAARKDPRMTADMVRRWLREK